MTSLLLTVGSDCCFSTYHYWMYRTNNSQGLVCLDMDKFDNIFTEQKYSYKEVPRTTPVMVYCIFQIK